MTTRPADTSRSDQHAEYAYVHVPFCSRRCTYCDFAIAVRRDVPWRAFAESVRNECAIRHVASQTLPLRTLYFGGGTPSRLGVDGVVATIEAIRAHQSLRTDAEVTLETNPEDVTPEALAAWRAAGVNRLSIGVQSFDDAVLAWMHRVHDASAARRAVAMARDAGFTRLSVDLIFALPEDITRDWQRDVGEALALDVEHVSLYGLTIEPHTPLGRQAARGTVPAAGDERYEREFLHAHDAFSAAGFDHYEVSNFGRIGHRAVHNSAYWQGVPYVGLGPSAHEFDGVVRRWNTSAFAAWERLLQEGRDPMEGSERLTDDNRIAETVYLGLRTTDGLPLIAREREHIARWAAEGWVDVVEITHDGAVEQRIRCTPMGWLRLDALAADLTAFRSHS